jgi:ATP adenylyltransferase
MIGPRLPSRDPGCVFCRINAACMVAANDLAFAIRDRSPATPLHTLILPRRHAASYFDLWEEERQAIDRLIVQTRDEILAMDNTVEGFNIGINIGEVAGQTVFHCHYHLIPRRRGDVPNPRGGVRAVIPGKADY